MRRSTVFFLLLLTVLNGFLFLHHHLVPLLGATIAVNAAACGWFIAKAFSTPIGIGSFTPRLRVVFIVMLLTLDAIVFMGAYLRLEISKQSIITLDKPLPALQWVAFDGSSHTLKEFAGRRLALHFWGSWCVPCRKEFPALIAYARRHPEVTLLAVDANDDVAKATRLLTQWGAVGLPNLFFAQDADSAISTDMFRIMSFPSTILVDTQGKMHWLLARPVEWENADLQQRMDALGIAH